MDSNRQGKESRSSLCSFSVKTRIHIQSDPISAHLAAQFNAQEPPTERKLPLEEFWKLETLGISEPVSVNDDDKALQKFNDNVRFEDERY